MAAERHKRHYKTSTLLYVTLMSMGSVAYAYNAGVIATTLGQPSFITYMALDTRPNASDILGATGSLYYAGGFFGSFFSTWIADRWGRKAAILVALIIVLVSAALCAGSVNIAMFIAFRTTGGFGGIMLSKTVPLWISECAPPEVRGAMSQFHGSAVDLGYLLASYVGVGFFYHVNEAGNNAWRGPQAIGILFCLPLIVGLWWVPESPRYLLMKGQVDKATEIVRFLHSKSDDTEHRYADMELYQMQRQIEVDRNLDASWLEMLRKPSYRKRFFMAIFVVFSLQATGSQVLTIYATFLFASLGFDPEKQLLLQAGLFAMMWPIATLAITYVEKFPRNKLIATGMACMTATLCVYTALWSEYLGTDNSAGQAAAVAMTFLFFAAYCASVEGPFYYYIAELFPTHLRAKGMTLQASTFCWTSIMWAQSAPRAIQAIGWHFFLIFIILSAIGTVVIFYFCPNTQGKSLEEIAAFFGDEDLVVVYQNDIHVDPVTNEISDDKSDPQKVNIVEDEDSRNPSLRPIVSELTGLARIRGYLPKEK